MHGPFCLLHVTIIIVLILIAGALNVTLPKNEVDTNHEQIYINDGENMAITLLSNADNEKEKEYINQQELKIILDGFYLKLNELQAQITTLNSTQKKTMEQIDALQMQQKKLEHTIINLMPNLLSNFIKQVTQE